MLGDLWVAKGFSFLHGDIEDLSEGVDTKAVGTKPVDVCCPTRHVLSVFRYLSRCKYKLVKEWSVDAQQITALSAVNSFFSCILSYSKTLSTCILGTYLLDLLDLNVIQVFMTYMDILDRCSPRVSWFVSILVTLIYFVL